MSVYWAYSFSIYKHFIKRERERLIYIYIYIGSHFIHTVGSKTSNNHYNRKLNRWINQTNTNSGEMWMHLCVLDDSCSSRQLCGGNQAATERMIQFGRELQALSEQLCRQYGKNATHKKMLQVGEANGWWWTGSHIYGYLIFCQSNMRLRTNLFSDLCGASSCLSLMIIDTVV